jgi:aspartate carbamoyltransferase catalytic subunit
VSTRSLLTVEDLGAEGIVRILDLADHMAEVNRRPNPKVPALRGKTVCSVFFEDSTRTRLSFETAAKRTRVRACATRSRRSRRWASTRSSCAIDRAVRRH